MLSATFTAAHYADGLSIISDDISVLKLAEAVSLTQYPNIKPACLPQQGRN